MHDMQGVLDEWPVKLASAEGLAFSWPYGIRALIAERERLQQIEDFRGHFFRYGYLVRANPHEYIFKVPLSFEEALVGSATQRITLMDRVRTYHNYDWKREAAATAQNLTGTAEQRFVALMQNLLVLQGLTDELKPETLELCKRCTSTDEVCLCMLNANA
jgi:hypothetical protein